MVDSVWYNLGCTAQLGAWHSFRKGVVPMETFQTLMIVFAFGSFLLALLTYIDKRK